MFFYQKFLFFIIKIYKKKPDSWYENLIIDIKNSFLDIKRSIVFHMNDFISWYQNHFLSKIELLISQLAPIFISWNQYLISITHFLIRKIDFYVKKQTLFNTKKSTFYINNFISWHRKLVFDVENRFVDIRIVSYFRFKKKSNSRYQNIVSWYKKMNSCHHTWYMKIDSLNIYCQEIRSS